MINKEDINKLCWQYNLFLDTSVTKNHYQNWGEHYSINFDNRTHTIFKFDFAHPTIILKTDLRISGAFCETFYFYYKNEKKYYQISNFFYQNLEKTLNDLYNANIFHKKLVKLYKIKTIGKTESEKKKILESFNEKYKDGLNRFLMKSVNSLVKNTSCIRINKMNTIESLKSVCNVKGWDGTVRHEKFKKDDIWIHSNSSEGDSWFKFNYCPMCGKPLNKKVSSAELYDQFITQWCKEHKERII